MWGRLKAELDNISITSKAMIKEHIQQTWADFFYKVIQLMPNRMAEVIKNRGAATYY